MVAIPKIGRRFAYAITLASAGFLNTATNAEEKPMVSAMPAVILPREVNANKPVVVKEEVREKTLTELNIELEKMKKENESLLLQVLVLGGSITLVNFLIFLLVTKRLEVFKETIADSHKTANEAREKQHEEHLAKVEKALEENKAKLQAMAEIFKGDILIKVRESIAEQRRELDANNPLTQIMGAMTSGMEGIAQGSKLIHILVQTDDDLKSALDGITIAAVGGVNNIEYLHTCLRSDEDFFKDYFKLEANDAKPPISSFTLVRTESNEDEEFQQPGETNMLLIPSEFYSDPNLHIALLARELSRITQRPENGYETLRESQITAFEGEVSLIESLATLLKKIELGISYESLKDLFPSITFDEDNFEGFKEFVSGLGLDPVKLQDILKQHDEELGLWKAMHSK